MILNQLMLGIKLIICVIGVGLQAHSITTFRRYINENIK